MDAGAGWLMLGPPNSLSPMTIRPALLVLLALGFGIAPAMAQEVTPDTLEAQTEAPDLAATLAADGRFAVLLDALATTGLDSVLSEAGPFTVFAPTDSAFADLPEGALDALSEEDLRTVLLYHVVEGDLDVDALSAGEPVPTLAGPTLDITPLDDGLVVNGVAPTGAGAAVSNGRIYALGTVLLPPAPESSDDDL